MTLLSWVKGIILYCEEWDTRSGKSYDLSVGKKQDDLDRQVAAGEFSFFTV